MLRLLHIFFFFFNDTATTEIYTLSLHDALPIYIQQIVLRPEVLAALRSCSGVLTPSAAQGLDGIVTMSLGAKGVVELELDRKSTRLNSSHVRISYAVFCLKKKQTTARSV